MPRDAREVMGALQRKGFHLVQRDHAYFQLYVDGKKTPIYTKVSHGEREIHDSLLGAMSRQLRLSKGQFGELVECPLSEAEYVGILREGGHIG